MMGVAKTRNVSFNEFLEELQIVVVSYRIPITESATWHSLLSTSRSFNLLIYDNSPRSQVIPTGTSFGITYYHNPSNPGLGTAYNYAAALATNTGRKWLLLLDQDSTMPSDFVDHYYTAIQVNADGYFFAPIQLSRGKVISPFRFKDGWTRRKDLWNPGTYSFTDFRVINSGCLICLELFQEAGGYLETLPLDFSDVFFQERVKSKCPSFELIDLVLSHDHSAANTKDMEAVKSRFQTFCWSARKMQVLTKTKGAYWWTSLKRALRLTAQFHSPFFLLQLFRLWR